MGEKTKFTLESRNTSNGELEVGVTVEGETEMPFWNHDLKIRAAIALLESVDYKDFAEDSKEREFEKYLQELEETINAIRSF